MLAKKLNMHSFQWQDLKRDIIGKKSRKFNIFDSQQTFLTYTDIIFSWTFKSIYQRK